MKYHNDRDFIFKNLRTGLFGIDDISDFEMIFKIKLKHYEKLLLINTGLTENILQIILESPIIINVKRQTERNNILFRSTYIELANIPKQVVLIANSLIYLKKTPTNILDEIRRKEKGLGKIIETEQLETYKKFVKFGYSHKHSKLYREYYIIHKNQKMIKIREILFLNNLKTYDNVQI